MVEIGLFYMSKVYFTEQSATETEEQSSETESVERLVSNNVSVKYMEQD